MSKASSTPTIKITPHNVHQHGVSSKIKYLNQASEILDEIKLLIQFSCDLKIISSITLGELAELYTEIGREIGGIIKYEYAKQICIYHLLINWEQIS